MSLPHIHLPINISKLCIQFPGSISADETGTGWSGDHHVGPRAWALLARQASSKGLTGRFLGFKINCQPFINLLACTFPSQSGRIGACIHNGNWASLFHWWSLRCHASVSVVLCAGWQRDTWSDQGDNGWQHAWWYKLIAPHPLSTKVRQAESGKVSWALKSKPRNGHLRVPYSWKESPPQTHWRSSD